MEEKRLGDTAHFGHSHQVHFPSRSPPRQHFHAEVENDDGHSNLETIVATLAGQEHLEHYPVTNFLRNFGALKVDSNTARCC